MLAILAALALAQTLAPEVPLSAGVRGASAGLDLRPRLAAIDDRALTVWSGNDGRTTSMVLTRDGHASRAAELPAGFAFFRDLAATDDRFLILYSDTNGTRVACYDSGGDRVGVAEL